MKDIDHIEQAKSKAAEISSTFCIAKWHMTTIYLQTGETHSCYHPPPHMIPIKGLKENPSSLHNTPEKKQQRLQMLNGEKPKGCQYCWNIEALGKNFISDRYERNWIGLTEEKFNEVKENPWDFNVNPEYIEISFGHECNFKCGYCQPRASSSYYKEIEKFGPYHMVEVHGLDNDFKIYQKEDENPYVTAWWQWWPEVKKNLKILRITGGEPLLQKSTWQLLEDLDKNPSPDLEINVNSNFGVKTILIERIAEKIKKLEQKSKIKKFRMYTSIDTWGSRAEYIRNGLDIELWEKNLDVFLKNEDFQVGLMITFNALSVTTFKDLLKKILEWREKYNTNNNNQRITFDTPYLKEPLLYDMNILTKSEFLPYMYDCLSYMESNSDYQDSKKFSSLEVEKFRRVVKYMETTIYDSEKNKKGLRSFYQWFTEHDRRRGTNFLKTFPEMKSFWELCKKENDIKYLDKE